MMDSLASNLPTILGAASGLIVATVGFLVQIPPYVCATRAVAAYMVFSAFGIVIRYLLGDSPAGDTGTAIAEHHEIAPGTAVKDLLAVQEELHS